ncbi:MAG: class I SAM-dependent methyltransferase [Microgenomates group bacterium]
MNLDEWWKTTFGKIYLFAFAPTFSQKRTKKEVNFIIKTLNLKKGAQILDIPCGYGRHSIELAKKGFQITGIDFSLPLLKEAKKSAKDQKVNCCFLKQDMRFLRLSSSYDAILVLGNSFGYFSDEDNEEVIKRLSVVLKSGGYLILDLPNAIGMIQRKLSQMKIKIPQGYIISKEVDFDPLHLIVKLRWEVYQNKKKTILHGKIRLYTFPEIKNLLLKYQLEVKNIFGSFNGEPYSLDSPRLIIIATKK